MNEVWNIALAIVLISLTGCGGDGKEAAVDWKRIDPRQYTGLDDLSLVKKVVAVDKALGLVQGEEKDEAEAVLADYGGKLDEKNRREFVNALILRDAFQMMDASHAVVTSVLERVGCSRYADMPVNEAVALLPGIAEVYGILKGMNTPPADIAEYLLDDYIDTDAEKRADRIKRFREKSEKYHVVKDALVSSGISSEDADAGLALFVFKYGSGLERAKFWDNEKTFANIDCKNVKALVPDCRKLRKILSTIKETKDKNMAEPLIDFMATPADERADALLQMETYVKTFVKNRKEYGDFAAALQAREVAEKAVKNRDKKARTTHDRVENKKTSNVVRRDNAKAPGYNQVHGVVVEFVREIVTEAEDAKIIFTDGSLDEEIREECKRRRVALAPCSMMDMEFSREAFMEKMTNGVAVAQFGLEFFRKGETTLKLCFSGTLFRCGKMSENVRVKGVEFTDKLAERILDLQKRKVVDSLSDKEMKDKFLSVQWRIARIARMRAEQEQQQGLIERATRSLTIAEKLDECNSVLKKIRDSLKLDKMDPRERMMLELRKANLEMAQLYARIVLKSNADDSGANFAMGMWHVQHERLSEAEKYLIRCRDGKPMDPAIWNNLAVIYLKTGKLAEAKRHVREALRLCPDLPEVKKTFEAIEKAMAK